MKDLVKIDAKEKLTLDSREVAELVGKRHDHLMRDIERYSQYISKSNDPKVGAVENFFIKSTYVDAKGQTRPNYRITKKGCEFIAHKLTGEKGTLFTAAYINRFHEMEEEIAKEKTKQIAEAKQKEIEARYNNSLVRKANTLRRIAEDPSTPKEYKQVLNAKAVEILTGQQLLPLPKTERTYSAGDIAKELGVSANLVGRVANANGLKTDEYGTLVWDKSPYCEKQVQTWRYNEKGRAKLIELLNK